MECFAVYFQELNSIQPGKKGKNEEQKSGEKRGVEEGG